MDAPAATTVDPARLWSVCIHESGHACCALLLGVPDIGACVFETGGGCGITTSTPATCPPPRVADWTPEVMASLYKGRALDDLMRDSVWTAGGCAAVDLILQPERTETTVTGLDGDMLGAMSCALFGPDPAVSVYWGALSAARARALLKPVLWRVKAVARELLRTRRMTADDIAGAMFPEASKSQPSTASCEAYFRGVAGPDNTTSGAICE